MNYLNNKTAWWEASKLAIMQSVILVAFAYLLVSVSIFGSVTLPSLTLTNLLQIAFTVLVLTIGILVAQEIFGPYASKPFIMKAVFASVAVIPYALVVGDFSILGILIGAAGFMFSEYVYTKIVGAKI